MLRIIYDKIEHRRGDTDGIELALKDSEGEEYVLQEGDRVVFSVKRTCDDTEYVLQKNFVNGKIEFLHEDTKSLPYGKYCYDIEVTLADGQVQTIANGMYCLLPDITV